MENNLINVGVYIGKNLQFLIPDYQRGYIWGKSRGNDKDSVSFLMESIINAFPDNDIFLQGVTICERDNIIELIDGQQRTTFLYLLLNYLDSTIQMDIKYPIRIESEKFLNSIQGKGSDYILSLCADDENEELQDIYYFKKTIRTIDSIIKVHSIDRNKLLKFILNKVKFLYIPIPEEKKISIFSMMNGNKAIMKHEEIIKAEMLRLVSGEISKSNNIKAEELESIHWEQNLLRSKYAREWDKWLYWWNRKEVKKFYQTDNVMGLLIETYFYSKVPECKFNYENFRDYLLRGDNNEFAAKHVFYDLRHLQKKFEDSYNDVTIHNYIGAIFAILSNSDREKFIRIYFAENKSIDISQYFKYSLLLVSHLQIINKLNNKNFDEKESDPIKDAIEILKESIEDDFLYSNKEHYDMVAAQLLRLNIEQDINLGRFFNFSIWDERSLEHIYPKSKVYHNVEGTLYNGNNDVLNNSCRQDKSYLNRADFDKSGSEHCIGNLVLLYKNENSKFGHKSFEEKKNIYFNLDEYGKFISRNLLHTVSIFAKGQWGVKEIQENKNATINEIKKYYGIH